MTNESCKTSGILRRENGQSSVMTYHKTFRFFFTSRPIPGAHVGPGSRLIGLIGKWVNDDDDIVHAFMLFHRTAAGKVAFVLAGKAGSQIKCHSIVLLCEVKSSFNTGNVGDNSLVISSGVLVC